MVKIVGIIGSLRTDSYSALALQQAIARVKALGAEDNLTVTRSTISELSCAGYMAGYVPQSAFSFGGSASLFFRIPDCQDLYLVTKLDTCPTAN
jgi:hypothetical protein